jgi:hypothetical protein
MKQQLLDRGYTLEQAREMKPEEEHKILGLMH